MVTPKEHGISLKAAHYGEILERSLPIGWAEALTENFLGRGGRPWAVLEHVRQDSQIILHGVSMSIGGFDPLMPEYFAALRRLADQIEAAFVSDHLCFGTFGGHHGHDLWPLPRTEEAIAHVVERVRAAQDMLGTQLVLENVSTYVGYQRDEIPEDQFVRAIVEEADAGILLDVNNVYVSAQNHGWDARAYIDGLPAERVRYIHLAGHADRGAYLLDNHGAPVCDEVWALYEYALARLGNTPTIVEWDSHLPTLDRLLAESDSAAKHAQRVLTGQRNTQAPEDLVTA